MGDSVSQHSMLSSPTSTDMITFTSGKAPKLFSQGADQPPRTPQYLAFSQVAMPLLTLEGEIKNRFPTCTELRKVASAHYRVVMYSECFSFTELID